MKNILRRQGERERERMRNVGWRGFFLFYFISPFSTLIYTLSLSLRISVLQMEEERRGEGRERVYILFVNFSFDGKYEIFMKVSTKWNFAFGVSYKSMSHSLVSSRRFFLAWKIKFHKPHQKMNHEDVIDLFRSRFKIDLWENPTFDRKIINKKSRERARKEFISFFCVRQRKRGEKIEIYCVQMEMSELDLNQYHIIILHFKMGAFFGK